MPLNNPSAVIEISTGSYSGDDGVNRAIPHGLSAAPKLVIITEVSNSSRAKKRGHIVGTQQASFEGTGATVTIANTTNFYVSDVIDCELNDTGSNYNWVAIG